MKLYWHLKINKNNFRFSEGDKAKGIGVEKTRIACQASEGGTLSDSFQLLKSPNGENDVNYCDKVQAEVEKAQGTSSGNDEGNSGQASSYESISQDDFTRCEMYSLADSNCQIRFYHNNIDHDKHFKHGDHVQVSLDKKIRVRDFALKMICF